MSNIFRSAQNRTEQNTVYTIQALRGIAAVLVVLFHATQYFSDIYHITPLGGFFLFGFSGVHIFFVLSGFIIFKIHFNDIGKPQKYFQYIIKRFIRIYPNYWVILAIIILLFPGSSTITIQDIYQNIGLLKMPPYFINPVCWTLSFEVLFYFIFSFLILNRIFGIILILCWVLGIAVTNMFDLQLSFFLSYAFHKYTVLFMIGLTSSYMVILLNKFKSATRNKLAYATCLGGLLVFSFTAFYCLVNKITNFDLWIVTIGFGLAGGCFMTCAISDTLEGFFQRQNSLTSVGDASYSIYLLHYVFLREVVLYSKINFLITEPISITLAFIAACALSVIVGWLFHLSIERPLLKFMRKLLPTGRSLNKTVRSV